MWATDDKACKTMRQLINCTLKQLCQQIHEEDDTMLVDCAWALGALRATSFVALKQQRVI